MYASPKCSQSQSFLNSINHSLKNLQPMQSDRFLVSGQQLHPCGLSLRLARCKLSVIISHVEELLVAGDTDHVSCMYLTAMCLIKP